MSTEADFIRIVRLHKRWADGYTLLTLLLILVLFTGTYVLYDQAGMDAAERTGALILMGTIILATAIWQAVGLGVARVHMLLEGMDLETRSKRGGKPPAGQQ